MHHTSSPSDSFRRSDRPAGLRGRKVSIGQKDLISKITSARNTTLHQNKAHGGRHPLTSESLHIVFSTAIWDRTHLHEVVSLFDRLWLTDFDFVKDLTNHLIKTELKTPQHMHERT